MSALSGGSGTQSFRAFFCPLGVPDPRKFDYWRLARKSFTLHIEPTYVSGH